ncbi:MAG: hypothetical protein ACE5FI_12570, partial [Anaerolineales bacterium]
MALTEKFSNPTGSGAHTGASELDAWSLTEAFVNAVAGDRVNVKNDATYTLTASLSLANAGSVTSPIWFRGYTTTIGDGDQGRTNGGTGALDTTNMPTIDGGASYNLNLATNYVIWESIKTTGALAAGAVMWASGQDIVFFRSFFECTGTASIKAVFVGSNTHIIDCDATNTSSTAGMAVFISAGQCCVYHCRITHPTGIGIMLSGAGVVFPTIVGCLIYECNVGVQSQYNAGPLPFLVCNTVVDCTTAAIKSQTYNKTTPLIACDNIFTDNGYIFYDAVVNDHPVFFWRNRTRDNTSANTGIVDWPDDLNAITTDTGGPETDYTDATNDDYTLIATSPAVGVGAWGKADVGAYSNRGVTGAITAYTSKQTGNWNDPATWNEGGTPTSAHDVTIQAGHTVTLTQNEAAKSATVDATGALDISTYDLTVTGTTTITGTLTIGVSAVSGLTTGGLTANTGAVINAGNTSKINNSGDFSFPNSQILASTSILYTQTGDGGFANRYWVNAFYEITIAAGATITLSTDTYISSSSTNAVTINGVIAAGAKKLFLDGSATTFVVGASGDITGTGTLSWDGRTGITFTNNRQPAFSFTGTFTIYGAASKTHAFPSADWRFADVLINHNGGEVVPIAGDIRCNNLTITSSGANGMTITNSTNNPNWTIYGNVDLHAGTGSYTTTWTKGTGTITFAGSGTQSLSLDGQALEDVVIDASVQLLEAFTTDTLSVRSGTFDLNGQTLTTVGDATIQVGATISDLGGSNLVVGGDFLMYGDASAYITVQGASAWTLNVTGSATAIWADISYCDASSGTTLSAYTCTDSGNNTNVDFTPGEIPSIDPGVGNVRESTAYNIDGTPKVGTYHEALPAEVQLGVQYGAGGTEYTGAYDPVGSLPDAPTLASAVASSGQVVVTLTAATGESATPMYLRYRLVNGSGEWSAESEALKRTGDGGITVSGHNDYLEYEFTAYHKRGGVLGEWARPLYRTPAPAQETYIRDHAARGLLRAAQSPNVPNGMQMTFSNPGDADVVVYGVMDQGRIDLGRIGGATDTETVRITLPRQTGFPPTQFYPGATVTVDGIIYEL